MKIIDLFCGMGGFSFGFCVQGFDVVGFDINKHSPEIFEHNKIGKAFIKNIADNDFIDFIGKPDIIIGGPPCKPWSPLNSKRRRNLHEDSFLVRRFAEIVCASSPKLFIMENVPNLKTDDIYYEALKILGKQFDIRFEIFQYSDYGAPTQRKRLFTIGFKDSPYSLLQLNEFFITIYAQRKKYKTVGEVFNHLTKDFLKKDTDHVWTKSKKLDKNQWKYKNKMFGHAIIELNKPSPSFGNALKTPIPHPIENRPLSIREIMAIMGFPLWYSFPPSVPLHVRYQMIADVVSPIFSEVLAIAAKTVLE